MKMREWEKVGDFASLVNEANGFMAAIPTERADRGEIRDKKYNYKPRGDYNMKRSEVAENLKWKIEDIFSSDEEFYKKLDDVSGKVDFSEFEGKLNNEKTLFECFEAINAVVKDVEILGVYAYMRHDEDTAKPAYNAMLAKVEMLEISLSEKTAFVMPELAALPVKKLKEFAKSELLSDYDYTIRNIIAEKPHTLSKECEQLLSGEGRIFEGFHGIFTMIDNADFPVPEITVDGKKTKVTHGTYNLLLHSPDRRVRKAAFKAYYKSYIGLINTITQTYSGNVEKDVFLAKARHFDTCLERALHSEDVAPAVYENLLESVEKALPLLHRYMKIRKKLLGVKELHMYDLYTPLVENAEIQVEYEEAFDIVRKGLAPLGEEYGELLQKAHDERWLDVVETEGKRSGAYSISVFGLVHPYVLLNYQKTTNEIFTIAHELGHAMHSYYSEHTQPQEKASYKIFVAEVASTVNEVLLNKYLIKNTDDKKLKKYLLSYYLDTLKGTLFRQTQFAEFEYIAHTLAEKGEPLTKDVLNEKYYELNKKYYGKAVTSDEEIAYEWARIPHFYRSFYVYKYATGIVSAVAIAERIYSEGDAAVEDYKKFLCSGGSDSPVELLKLAGVDLTKPEVFESCMQSFENALDEFERL